MDKRFMVLVLWALYHLLNAVIFEYTDTDSVKKLKDEMATLSNNIENEI